MVRQCVKNIRNCLIIATLLIVSHMITMKIQKWHRMQGMKNPINQDFTQSEYVAPSRRQQTILSKKGILYDNELKVKPPLPNTNTVGIPAEIVSEDNRRKPIISTNIDDKRRLGNYMFNYASMLGIARRNNMEPICRRWWLIHKTFRVKMRQEDNMLQFGMFTPFYVGKASYDRSTENLTQTNIMLNGYFQSWKYFENVESELKDHFVFHKNVTTAAQGHLMKIIPEDRQDSSVVRVGIHVRRGYFARNPRNAIYMANSSYYNKAMDFFRDQYKDVIFILCSDDMEWSKANVKGPDVFYSGHPSASVDFAILASCDHMIMSIGTFGWWASWYANGTTVYYNWYHSDRVYHLVNYWPYFKPEWIPMW